MSNSIGFDQPLYNPPEGKAKVDIVFVHGLGGDRIRTWTFKNNEVPSAQAVTWPRDLLPAICPTARILTFGYDSHFAYFYPLTGSAKPISHGTDIDTYSSNLYQNLSSLRQSTKTPADRPVIYVAHSLGGLVIANALSRQHGADEMAKALTDNCVGVVFLGTPFLGSDKAGWGEVGLKIYSLFSQTKRSDVSDLKERSVRLTIINDSFGKFLQARAQDRSKRKVETVCYFEEHWTYVGGKEVPIVTKESATAPNTGRVLSIPATHSNKVKFRGAYDNGFKSVAGVLAEWIKALDEPFDGDKQSKGGNAYMGAVSNNYGIINGIINGNQDGAVRQYGATIIQGYKPDDLDLSRLHGN